jgi:hypothetical protein
LRQLDKTFPDLSPRFDAYAGSADLPLGTSRSGKLLA